MSIKKRIYYSLFISVVLTLTFSSVILYVAFYKIVDKRIKETYELVYKNYKEILNKEEENLKLIGNDTSLLGTYYIRRQLPTESRCEDRPYYRVFNFGPYYGINRKYPDGCYFVGVRLENVLKLTNSLIDVDWVVFYERSFLLDVLDGDVDSFMKEKIAMNGIIIDLLSKRDIVFIPFDVSGYKLHGAFTDRRLLMEVPFVNFNRLQVGKIILVKDVSHIYREAYTAFSTLLFYSVIISLSLALVLFQIASRLANRVILLKNVTASIEKKDFSVIEVLENSEDSCKDEVNELKHSIYNMAVSLKSAFEELEKKKSELEQLAYYDPLTGLPNRRFFFDHANLIFENSKRYGTPFSLLVMDIDFFKKINDTYGHDAGDLVLKSFADVLRKSIRQSDLPARFGGEEFVLLMSNTNLQQAKVVAERIRTNFQNSLIVYEGNEIKATLSGGLASFPAGVEKIDELIKMADEALYKAKESGRNRIEVYTF